MTRLTAVLSCVTVLVLASSSSHALAPSTPLADLRAQNWVVENGLPQNTVHALAQSLQGYIWIGTEAGLVRFDGREFQTFDRASIPSLPSDDIDCLLAAKDGALWIGTQQGLARRDNGTMTAFSKRDGLSGDEIRGIVQADDGSIWVWTNGGLARLKGSRFEPATRYGLPQGEIMAVYADRGGTLWVAEAHTLESYAQGRWAAISTPASMPLPQGGVALAQKLPDGTVALAGTRELLLTRAGRLIQRLTVGDKLPGARIQALLADREGTLWIGTNKGLARLVDGDLRVFPTGDAMSTASVLALFEDREGNLWVGTETNGLHILRDRRFFTFAMRQGLPSDGINAVVEDRTGMLWVGTRDAGLSAVPLRKNGNGSDTFPASSAVRTYNTRNGLASNVILSLAAGADGEIWIGTPDGLNEIHGRRVETYTLADGLPDDLIRSLLVDDDGSLWIGTRHGLAHWTAEFTGQKQIRIYTQMDGLGSDLVGAMARDARGDLWVATLAGLSRMHNGKIANFTMKDGLLGNVVTAILPRKDGTLLIGTESHGLELWDGQKFFPVTETADRQSTIHAMLDDAAGHLWLATANGLARCDLDETRGGACSNWSEFGTADGLPTQQMATNSHPSAWRGNNGRLWFATARGLFEVDAAHFRLNTLPPPVVVERFAIDNVVQRLHPSGAALKIAPGHADFEFDYAGLSFVAPQEVRYRYRLQGFDRDWTEAGARRAAYYTNIPPGHYIFQVQAANNDGLWNTAGTRLSFDVQRHFYQTLWFYTLLLLGLMGSIFLLLRLRLRVAQVEFRAVLRERTRIAREIHDTLAQGYVGVSVQLELLAELLRRKKLNEASSQLDATRDYVRAGLADARQSIWALRTQDSGDEPLPVKLRSMVDRAADADLQSRFATFGTFRPLATETERELLRIAEEAIRNVKKHAAASELSVRLEYGQETVVLEVRDDGRGGAQPHRSGFTTGHFGITGIQERVEAIGGILDIQSTPGMGTTILLRVPVSASRQEVEQGQS